MKTEKKEEKAKYRVIVRDEITFNTASFPIYHDDIDVQDLADKLEEYVKKL